MSALFLNFRVRSRYRTHAGLWRQRFGERVMVGEARKRFNGLMRNNDTADFICRQLQSETTEEAIVEAMFEEYDAPREVIAADVHAWLEQIRETGLLEERAEEKRLLGD